MKISLKSLKAKAEKEISGAEDLKELDVIFKNYLGKEGELTRIFKSLDSFGKSQKAKIGKEANELKDFLKVKIDHRVDQIKEKIQKAEEAKEWIDITIPGKKPILGSLHPLTKVKREIEAIFQSMGFEVVEGSEVEDEWHNFDTLNVPPEHPAREMQDTLWLHQERSKEMSAKERLLMRTHTSPVQVHYMEKNNPPLRIIVPGRVFRHEATDASHEINFYQIEGLMVQERGKVSVSNFKALIGEFFKRFLKTDVEIRLRPSFFPFTEPSFEIDVSCPICAKKGCSTCKKSGWVEVAGAGMVHPNVFKNSGLNPKDWQGFAFGLGIDRLTMIKYKINDIRLFYGGDLRFLKQF